MNKSKNSKIKSKNKTMSKNKIKEKSISKNKIFTLDGAGLDIDTVYEIATAPNNSIKILIDQKSRNKMVESRNYVKKIVEKGQPVYGINTGFGALSSKHISREHLDQLQINLIRSHCTGVGKPFSRSLTRTIMLLRANCLIAGYSGVNPSIVDLLIDFLNLGIHPIIPEKGSVGASGDLAPLAHLSLALIGESEVEHNGSIISSLEAMKQFKLSPAKLGPKDGLALINGTAVMTALGSMALNEAFYLVKLADIVGATTVEALKGSDWAFQECIMKLKPHSGQMKVASNLLKLLKESQIRESHRECKKVQDPYSLRCMPQVHGAVRQTLHHAREVIEVELNSVTDNPLVFANENLVLSGGNFHGEALALSMDYLSMGLAELCNICERRIEKLMNPTFSELPPFLTKESGLNSGLMMAHVTVAALVSENKYLAHPASIDSIPTSTDKEDHVSMGVTSGLKLFLIIENLKHCLAVEILCNTQGLEFLRPMKPSSALQEFYRLVREKVPPIERDRVFAKDIKLIYDLIESRVLLDKVQKIVGELQ